MADIVLKPVPLHPLTILTPPLAGKPDEKTLELIRTAVERICADDVVYSVTNSPVLCPVDKRYLYVLHPHYWQKDDGTWGKCTYLPACIVAFCQPKLTCRTSRRPAKPV